MKVTGWGNPDQVRIRFARCEVDLLVDVLRQERAEATRVAAETYDRPGGSDERTVDDQHDRLRAIEALLMQLEHQTPDDRGRVVLVGDTDVMTDIVQDGAIRAVHRLEQAHERYHDHPGTATNRDALLGAASTAQAWMVTLTSFDQVDQPRDDE
jgi:hypothetical protein